MGITGLLRTLLIIGIIWLVWRLLRFYVFPYLFRKGVNRMQENMRQRMEDAMRQQQGYEEHQQGDVTIRKSTDSKKGNRRLNDDAGEYVDFEEVDD